MLRFKLKSSLRQRGITQVALADAVAEAFIDSGKGVSDRCVHYLTHISDRAMTFKGKQRTPSLEMLDKLITGLRYLTGEEITLDHLIEYVTEGDMPSVALPEEQPTSPHEANESQALVESLDQEADEALEELRELIVQSLKTKGYEALSEELASWQEVPNDHDARRNPGDRKSSSRGLPIMLFAPLLAATAFIIVDQLVLKPRLVANFSRLVSFRDRVRPTSDLPVPTLVGPEGDVDQLTPTLRVLDVDGALAYEFYVENTVSDDHVYTGPQRSTSFVIPDNTLCPNTTYSWRARALGKDGWTSFSSPLEFTVTPAALSTTQQHLLDLAAIKRVPTTPKVVAPIGTTNTTTPTLELEAAPDVYGYGFYIRDLQDDGLVYDNNFATSSTVTIPEGVLKDGGVYQWNARSRNCHYWSEFIPGQIFTVNVTR
jgi:hypothetical protein